MNDQIVALPFFGQLGMSAIMFVVWWYDRKDRQLAIQAKDKYADRVLEVVEKNTAVNVKLEGSVDSLTKRLDDVIKFR